MDFSQSEQFLREMFNMTWLLTFQLFKILSIAKIFQMKVFYFKTSWYQAIKMLTDSWLQYLI